MTRARLILLLIATTAGGGMTPAMVLRAKAGRAAAAHRDRAGNAVVGYDRDRR